MIFCTLYHIYPINDIKKHKVSTFFAYTTLFPISNTVNQNKIDKQLETLAHSEREFISLRDPVISRLKKDLKISAFFAISVDYRF